MKKNGKLSKVVAACAAAALASSMMAGAAFAAEYPGTDGETSIATSDSTAQEATGNTGIYLQMTDTSVISVTVPTSIYLAADAGEGAVDFAVPTNARIVNNGKAVSVTGWTVAAANGMKAADFNATVGGTDKPDADKFYLQASIDTGYSWKDLADNDTVTAGPTETAWSMAKYGSATGVTSLDLQLQGKIYNPTTSKYANAPLIDTVTWNIKATA